MQSRDFWRANTTKEDIARELYKHKLKLEAKQAERDAHAAEARAERTRASVIVATRNDKHRRPKSPEIVDDGFYSQHHHHDQQAHASQLPKSVLSFNISPPDEVGLASHTCDLSPSSIIC